jgi:hypothetical protein
MIPGSNPVFSGWRVPLKKGTSNYVLQFFDTFVCILTRGGRVTHHCPLSVDQIGISVKSCPLMAEG